MYNYIIFSNLIKNICKPLLDRTPIDDFIFIEVDCEGGILILQSDPTILHTFERKKLTIPTIKYLMIQQKKAGRYYLDMKNSLQLDGIFNSVANELNINHCMMIVKHGVRNNKTVLKYFFFTSSHETEEMTNYYFNNLETVSSFTKYIEKRIKNLLYTKRKIILPDIVELFNLPSQSLSPTLLFNDLPQSSKLNPLTPREMQMISLYIKQNSTAKETAADLNISVRTVEKHWENIREKLNYIEKSDVKKIFNEVIFNSSVEHTLNN